MMQGSSNRNDIEYSSHLEYFKKAQNRPGDAGNLFKTLPTWVDPTLLKKGQEFIKQNFISIFFAHFISLLFLLCYPPVRNVLFKTGKSETISKSTKRYFSTILHIKLWYENDLLDFNSQAFQDIQNIRKIHSGVAQRVSKSESHCLQMPEKSHEKSDFINDNNTRKLILTVRKDLVAGDVGVTKTITTDKIIHPISQLDMVVTQFCFMGFASLFSKKVGIATEDNNNCNTEGLEGFVHIWALIGHFLGIDDEFNICLKQNLKYRQIIWEKVLQPNFCQCQTETFILWTSFISGISSYIYCITLKSVLMFILKNFMEIDHTNSHLYSILSLYEKFCYRQMCRCFSFWIQFSCVRLFLNSLFRFAIWLTVIRFQIKIKNSCTARKNVIQNV